METKNAFKIASVYIGTLIGAGFASGQEIMCFFANHGVYGVYGIVLTTILLSIMAVMILRRVYKRPIRSYQDFTYSFLDHRMQIILEIFICSMALILYCVMLAGSGALIKGSLGYDKTLGIMIMSGVCFVTFLFSVGGLAFVNSILIPILIGGIILIGGAVIPWNETMMTQIQVPSYEGIGNWITFSLLYVSYNTIGASMVLCSMKSLLNTSKVPFKAGIMIAIGLFSMFLFLLLPILIFYQDLQTVEIPMLYIASKISSNVAHLYGGVLWAAMLTTAISNGFLFIQTITKRIPIPHVCVCILFCVGTIPLSQFGFKTLVQHIYPILGYVSIFMMLCILFKKLKIQKN